MNEPAPRPARTPATCAAFLAGEPFRLLFPLGAFWAVAGVLLWPSHYAGWLAGYPALAHPRIMIEGFLGAFVFGFLGTAGPRLLGTPRFSAWELAAVVLLHGAGMTAHVRLDSDLGDTLFLCALSVFALGLAIRAVFLREDDPPPPMLMAALGLGCAFTGLITGKVVALTGGDASLRRFAVLLLYQGFLLLPILGVGTFFFPRLLGVPMREGGHAKALACALLVIASFAVEAWFSVPGGLALRAVAAGVFLATGVPWGGFRLARAGTLSAALKLSLGFGLAGLLAAALLPAQHIALEHLLYVGCFGLLTLVVASRVVLGHSGQGHLATGKLWPVRVITGLALLAALTRATANFIPKVLDSHYLYAAIAWALAVLVWLFWQRRGFFRADPD